MRASPLAFAAAAVFAAPMPQAPATGQSVDITFIAPPADLPDVTIINNNPPPAPLVPLPSVVTIIPGTITPGGDGDDDNNNNNQNNNDDGITPTLQFINPTLIPPYGVTPLVNANAVQIGSCDGFSPLSSEKILIPCFCPPDRTAFLQKLDAAVGSGKFLDEAIAWSNDVGDQTEETVKERATAMIIVLQSFNGTKGVGCPASAAPNFLRMQLDGVKSEAIFVA